MSNINLNGLYDKALDVDPDIRFMALEDLKKYLSNESSINSKALERFVPILFRLLHDSNGDVQASAVKSFAPMIKFLTTEVIINIVEKLFHEIQSENEKDSNLITVSIPNMALRSIFTSSVDFSYQTSRQVLTSLLPQILSGPITVDSIEILTYLIKNLGSHLNMNEKTELANYLAKIILEGYGIIGKRAIVALDYLLMTFSTNDFAIELLNQLVTQIISSQSDQSTFFEVLSVIVKNASIKTLDTTENLSSSNSVVKNSTNNTILTGTILSKDSITSILNHVFDVININELTSKIDPSEVDYDTLTQKINSKEEALAHLDVIINSIPFKNFEPFLDEFIEIMKACLKYDPLNFGDHMSDDEYGLDSDIEFSDEEDFEDSNDDDLSWKFRKQAANVISALSIYSYDILGLIYSNFAAALIDGVKDRNDTVSNASIDALSTLISKCPNSHHQKRKHSDASMTPLEDSPIYQLSNIILPNISNVIFQDLLLEKKIERLPVFLKLIQNLSIANEGLPIEFLSQLFEKLQQFKNKTTGVIEYLSLYKVLIETNGGNLPLAFVNFIINDLANYIGNEKTFHNIIMECLNSAIILFKYYKGQENLEVNALKDAILDKCFNKVYTSELRQKSVSCLSELIFSISIEVDSNLLNTYVECLKFEATVKTAVENLGKRLLNESCINIDAITSQPVFLKSCTDLLINFISSSDESLFLISLRSLIQIALRNKLSSEQGKVLMNFALNKAKDINQLKLSLYLLRHCSIESIDVNFIGLIAQKFENQNGDLVDLLQLITFSLKFNNANELFEILSKVEDLNIRAITLSTLCVEGKLDDKILEAEIELENNRNLLFNLQFLGNVSSKKLLQRTDFKALTKFLDDSNEYIKNSAAEAIGKFVSYNPSEYLPLLINEYIESQSHRELILVSFKQFVSEPNELKYTRDIWDAIWRIQDDETNDVKVSESKLAGETLSTICKSNEISFLNDVVYRSSKEDLSLSATYSIIAILKNLLSSRRLSVLELEPLFKLSTKFFDIVNISIKQALVGTFLTALHNKPDIILPTLVDSVLPNIYSELDAKAEFKKTIPMGPYKYNIDEGLEIRKLAYEFLYGLLNLDKNLTTIGVNYTDILHTIINKGFSDKENDIIVIACDTVSFYVNKDASILNNAELFDNLFKQIQLISGKKLKAKPSRQEQESYEECQKGLLKLCKSIAKIVDSLSDESTKIHLSGEKVQEWHLFMNGLLNSSSQQS